MDWKDIASNVAKVAPGIGAAIGGPAGSVVGLGVKALCGFFGIDSGAQDAAKQVEQALNNMTAAEAIELKKADQDFQIQMEELGVKVFELEAKDRDSARQRERDVGSRETAVLAYLMTVAFVVAIGMVLYAIFFGNGLHNIGEMAAGLIGILIGHLANKVEQVYGYFFGSSKGSHAKTGALAQQIGKALESRQGI
ncbi:MAG TPA: hypothetical protein DHV36_06010 [Desulfobacteraceae bacterium]|nr:hypothetical protein [Desulfobacteraceae bacterium]|tara:strand:+ start:6316 stop:6900 length:585 start_codon:yes stop_codon:yes gene_type:complete